MKKLFKRLRSQKGQSMVEMAIIMPLMFVFLIGVFEVGWTLRGYLVLINANREAARFTIRPGYLNFGDRDPAYSTVVTQAQESIADQLPVDFTTVGTMTLTHFVADTGYPCEPETMTNDDPSDDCDCNALFGDPDTYDPAAPDIFTQDDIIIHPGTCGFDFYVASFPPMTTTATAPLTTTPGSCPFLDPPPVRTNIADYEQFSNELARQNNLFNCQLLNGRSDILPSANNLMVTEMYYEQPQLFGFPFISNPFTDPVPLYSQTTMRMGAGARTSEGSGLAVTVGPVCIAHPWAVNAFGQDLRPQDPGVQEFGAIEEGQRFNSLSEWVVWSDGNQTDAQYLQNALRYPRMSFNDDALKEGGGLYVGREVFLYSGTQPPLSLFDTLVGQRVIIPVLNGTTIVEFIQIVPTGEIRDEDADGNIDYVEAIYEGSAVNVSNPEDIPLCRDPTS